VYSHEAGALHAENGEQIAKIHLLFALAGVAIASMLARVPLFILFVAYYSNAAPPQPSESRQNRQALELITY
jgi:hypothetical protein